MIRPSSIRVTCLRCRHEGILAPAALARFGLPANAPISAFVKRLRCSECGSGSVATRRAGRRHARHREASSRMG